MIKVDVSAVIDGPVEEVFSYVARPENARDWDRGLVEMEVLTEGEFGVGTRMREKRRGMGSTVESIEEIVEYEPNRKLAWHTVEGSVIMDGSMTLEEVEGGVKATFKMQGELGFFSNLMSPLINWMIAREMRKNFRTLKSIIEDKQPSAAA